MIRLLMIFVLALTAVVAHAAQPVVDALTDSLAVGIPQNGAAVHVRALGTHFVFYAEDDALKCRYGSVLGPAMTATDTDTSGNIADLENGGRAYSICYGEVAGTPYAWAHIARTTSGNGFQWYRWELTSSGLGTPTIDNPALDNQLRTHVTINANPGGDVTELMAASQIWNSSASTRHINAAMSVETGLGSIDAAAIDFPEHTHIYKVSDGYLAIANDEGATGEQNGNFGHFSEWTRADYASGSWSSEDVITGSVSGASANDGDYADQNYGINASHAGQQAPGQTRDARLYLAYVDNADLANGDHGLIKLVRRGAALADGWELLSADVIGGSTEAWHVALCVDGNDVIVFWVEDASGVDSEIKCRRYDSSADSFGAIRTVARIQAGYTFVRMSVTPNTRLGKPVLVWSEYDGTSTYDVRAQSFFPALGDLDGLTLELAMAAGVAPDPDAAVTLRRIRRAMLTQQAN